MQSLSFIVAISKHPLRSTPRIKMKSCFLFSLALGNLLHNPVSGFVNQLPSQTRLLLTPEPAKKLPPFSTICSAQYGTANSAITSLASTLFRSTGPVPLLQSFGLNALLFTALSPKLFTMLTPAGFLHSCALGTFLWNALGYKGWSLCVLYLFLGQLVTKIKFAEKEKAGISEKRGGRRGPENVWGSALTALICAKASVRQTLFGLPSRFYLLAYVASLSTKLADTFASEIGKAYGKTTFLITTFERVKPGTEGAVSAEGSAASVLGGFLLAIYGYAIGFITPPGVAIATTAAFLATNVESLLGATLQEKDGWEFMTNEVVNFINTFIGAALAIAGGYLFL